MKGNLNKFLDRTLSPMKDRSKGFVGERMKYRRIKDMKGKINKIIN